MLWILYVIVTIFLLFLEKGEAFVWSKNEYNQVGTIDSDYLSESGQVTLNKKFVQVARDKNFILMVTENGEVYDWGYRNSDGQLRNCATQRIRRLDHKHITNQQLQTTDF